MDWSEIFAFHSERLSWYVLPIGFLVAAFVWYWNVRHVIGQFAEKCGWGPGWVKETMEALPSYRKTIAVHFVLFGLIAAPIFTFLFAAPMGAFLMCVLPPLTQMFAMRPIRNMAEEAAQRLMSQAA